MRSPSHCLKFAAQMATIMMAGTAMAQRGSVNDPARSGGPVDLPSAASPIGDPNANPRSVFIAGKVVIQGGGASPDHVAIERECNGTIRHEGYTDSKGEFQFELGRNQQERDASQSDSDRMLTTRGGRNSLGGGVQIRFDGCELRASLPGFVSTQVPMRVENDITVLHVPTIFLSRLSGVPGSTVSVTSMSAPRDAQNAFEKARKAGSDKKFDEAMKELTRAVTLYPQYAAAWSLMGEIHRLQNRFDEARKEYERALEKDPKYVSPYFGLATIAVMEKKWAEAVQYSDQVIQLNAYAYPMAYYFSAAAYYNLGRLKEAEQSARKFQQVDISHSRPDIALLLGNILAARYEYAEAAQLYRGFLAAHPDASNAEELRKEAQRLESLSAARK